MASGCAQDPLLYVSQWNPVLRRQWEEDEQIRPSLHTRRAWLADLRRRFVRMDPVQQTQAMQQLAVALAQEPSEVMRRDIVRTLGELAGPAALATLVTALQDPAPLVRMAGCQALARTGDPQALVPLIRTLRSDSDVDVRIAAARALGAFADPRAIAALGELLTDQDPALQHQAILSLQQATGKSYRTVAQWQAYLQGADPGPEPQTDLLQRLRRLL